MPPLGGALNDEQIASVLTYIRREWGHTAPPVAPEDVLEIRGLTKTRTKPWTDAELATGTGRPRRSRRPRRAALTEPTGKPRNILDAFRLDGRVALVTGGARGLGLTMATALAEAGADIAISGRTRSACEEAVAQIAKETGRQAAAFEADVTKGADVEKLAADVESALGQGRHPDQQRRHQHPRPDSGTVRSRLGRGHRHQPQGPVALRARDRPADGGPRLGPRDQHRLDPRRDCDARAHALRVVQGGHHQHDTRAGARVGRQRRDRPTRSARACSGPR